MDERIFGLAACVAWYFVGKFMGYKKGHAAALEACDSVISEVIADVQNGDYSKWTDDEKSEDS
jgi:hypothetical protein